MARSVALSLPTLSHAPSSSYRQHHDVIAPRIDPTAFRPGWLVQTRLWSLLDTGRIERDGLDAALTWKRWFEIAGGMRVQSWEVRIEVNPVGRGDNGMAGRIDAAARLRAAAQVLGPLRIALLEAVVVHDQAWTGLGRSLRVSDKTARDRTVEAIIALAAHLAGNPVPSPPLIRFRNQPGVW